jgi:hypothetical protein
MIKNNLKILKLFFSSPRAGKSPEAYYSSEPVGS